MRRTVYRRGSLFGLGVLIAAAAGAAVLVIPSDDAARPAPAPQAVAPPAGANAAPVAPQPPLEYAVRLVQPGEQTIAVIKEIRAITGLGLADAKALCDGAPQTVTRGLTREDAETVAARLAAVGATAEIRPGGGE